MAFEIMDNIRKAEANAQQVLQNAQRQGREIIKASEEASLANEKNAEREMREAYQTAMEERRLQVEKIIRAKQDEQAARNEQARQDAMQRVPQAARYIVERVLGNGNR